MRLHSRGFVGLLVGLSCLSSFASSSLADGSSALKLAPRGANAAMTIDVAKLIQSPLGKAADLQAKLTGGYADRPLAVPATARNVTMVAGVLPAGLDSIWQVAIVELPTKPRLDAIVTAQGGYGDTIQGKAAGWSKHNIYYVQLDDQTFGVVRPGQRQFVSRWLAAKGEGSPSAYLTSALAAGAGADAVFAVDLDGAVATSAARYASAMGSLPSLESLEPEVEAKLVDALASVKGLAITMRATDKLSAEWVVEFGQDVSALGGQAKPFVIDVLTAVGLYEGDADKWEFKVDGKRIVGTGTMDIDALSRLAGLLAPGGFSTDVEAAAPAAAAPAAQPAAGQPAAAQPADPATASLKYYQAVAKSLDQIGQKISPTQGAVWLSAQAKAIEQLPLLNVDPALSAWGGQVADAYRRAGQALATGQLDAQNAALGIASPTAQGSYNTSGFDIGHSAADRAANRNAQQQRRQAAQTERVAAAESALSYFNEIAPLRGKLRAEMTQKYGIAF